MPTALGRLAVGALMTGALWGGLCACGGNVITGGSNTGGSGASGGTVSPGGTTSSGGESSGGATATSGGGTTSSDTGGTGGGVASFDWHDVRLYNVDVDRFSDGDPSNNFGSPDPIPQASAYQGGDWKGLKQKIEEGYFTNLGVNALLVTSPVNNADVGQPVNFNGHWYSGYMGDWPVDLDSAESHFGSMDEFQAAVDAAHAQGIQVIARFEPRHVHADAQVFADHPDWFMPDCICGDLGCPGLPDATCWYASYLPAFDLGVAGAQEYVLEHMVSFLLQTRVDGLSIEGVHNLPGFFPGAVRQRVTQDVEPITLQHVFLTSAPYVSDPSSFVEPLSKLDGTTMFLLPFEIIATVLMREDAMSKLGSALEYYHAQWGSEWQRVAVADSAYARPIGFAQDVPLWSDPYADGAAEAWMNQPGLPAEVSAFERLGVAFGVVFTIAGIPEIHAGDEIGLPGAGQPDNTRMMQWSGETQAQNDLRARVSKLTAARAAHEALRRGDFKVLHVTLNTLVYSRIYGADSVFVALNRGDASQSASGLPAGAFVDLLTGEAVSGPTVLLPPRSIRVLVPAS